MTFDENIEAAIAVACEQLLMTREEAIRFFVREWLEQYGFLPFQGPDEGSEMGTAQAD